MMHLLREYVYIYIELITSIHEIPCSIQWDLNFAQMIQCVITSISCCIVWYNEKENQIAKIKASKNLCQCCLWY
jgi:hypothetical protein